MSYVNVVLLGSYKELHEWSVNNYAEFWEECFQFFDILHSAPYSQVWQKIWMYIVLKLAHCAFACVIKF